MKQQTNDSGAREARVPREEVLKKVRRLQEQLEQLEGALGKVKTTLKEARRRKSPP